jgi:hypothetical protein
VVSLISPLSGIREHNSLINISDINERCYKKSKQARQKANEKLARTGFSIEDHNEYWRITGVQEPRYIKSDNNPDTVGEWQKETSIIDLLKTPLENGTEKTQDDWIEYSKQHRPEEQAIAMSNNTLDAFIVPSLPTLHAALSALYDNKDHPQYTAIILEAQEKLKTQLYGKYHHTLSNVTYQPKGKDIVTHQKGQLDAYQVPQAMIGSKGYIKEISAVNELHALTGSNDTKHINSVYQWLTSKDTYLWRLNEKPEETIERPVGIGIYDVRFDLIAIDYVDGRPALGVRAQAPKFSSGNKGK